VRAAVAVGVDGIFAEVHPHPENELSDGPNSIDYTMFGRMVSEVLAIRGALGRPA
jgi:3-deoxy-D-arabino-heptulosonate 7-phosphate (DAHP) synthase